MAKLGAGGKPRMLPQVQRYRAGARDDDPKHEV
jgi:hypothetical protein